MYKQLLKERMLSGILLLVVLSLGFLSCLTKEKKDRTNMDQFISNEVLGWNAEKINYYDRETIFDYMNGAGEIYRLYSYRELLVKRFSKVDKPDITIEIFDMDNSEEAYGIFSHSHHFESAGIGQGSQYHNGSFYFWKGKYYICISAVKKSSKIKEVIFKFAQIISDSIKSEGKLPEILKCLPDDGLADNSTRYFHRHESLNCYYYLSGSNILNLNEETEAVLAKYNPDKAFLLIIDYKDIGLANKAYESFVKNYIPEADGNGLAQIQDGKWVKILLNDCYVVIVLDANDSAQANKIANTAITNIEM